MAKDTINIDFGKEEDTGGGGIKWPDGDYHVKIIKAVAGRSSEKDTPMITVTFKVLDGKKKGKTFTERLYITPKSLKRVRLLLESVGVKVPKKAVNIPLKKLAGKTLWVELEQREEEGYGTRSRVTFEGFMSEDDYDADEEVEDDDEDDDEEDDDVDDLDEEDDDDEEEDDEDEDDDDDEEEEEEKPRKTKAKKGKSKSKKKSKKSDDDIEELDLDEL